MAKGQLHQLLAVENDRKQKANVILSETRNTFNKKQDHFDGIIKTYVPDVEGGDRIPPQSKEVVTTVSEKLFYNKKAVVAAMDAQISKEETNSSGDVFAEIEIDGKAIRLSATSLLATEQYLVNIRAVYKDIPTLDPTRVWLEDKQAGNGRFKTEAEVVFRTKKTPRAFTLHEGNDKHKPQVELVNEDVQVGHYDTVYQSGRLTAAQKSELLGNIDELIIEVKRARARANKAEVKNTRVGNLIFDHIHRNIV